MRKIIEKKIIRNIQMRNSVILLFTTDSSFNYYSHILFLFLFFLIWFFKWSTGEPRRSVAPNVLNSCLFSFKMLTLIFLLLPLVLLVARKLYLKKFKSGKNVCVLVLGDIGRSPRMQYHAVSFAREGFTVDIVGYPGSSPIREISENASVQVHYLRPPPELQDSTNRILTVVLSQISMMSRDLFSRFSILVFVYRSWAITIALIVILGLPRLLCYMIKVIWQTADLLWLLLCKRISDSLIAQNPPAIPTIPVCWFYCVLMEAQFTIDWHNYAHSLMALSLGKNHVLVRLARFIETTFGCRAKNNFCVTKAMKDDLEKKWAIQLVHHLFTF